MTFLALTGLINFISSAALAVVVYRKCPRQDLARIYGFTNLSIAWWAFFFFVWQLQTKAENADWPMRLLMTGGVWVNQGFLFFAFTLSGVAEKSRKVLWPTITLSLLFTWLILAGQLYDTISPAYGLGFWPAANVWTVRYLIFWHAEVLAGLGVLLHALWHAIGIQRKQLLYVLIASALGYLGGISTWPIWFRQYFPPHLIILVTVYATVVAYAILKHQLLDISLIIRKTLLYSVFSAVLASIYAGVITLLARLVEGHPAVPNLHPAQIFQWFGNSLKISFAYSCVATSIFSLSLGLFVWFKGRDKPVNRIWALTCLSISIWGLGLGMVVRAPTWNNAYLWERWVQYPGAIMIPILFLHFVMLAFKVQWKPMLWFGYGLAIFLQMLNAAGDLVSIKVQPPFDYYALGLEMYWIFVINFLVLVLYAHGLVFSRMFASDPRVQNQARYFFLAMVIGFCGGATSFFPVFNIPIFPYGVYATPVYIVIVTYAIFKHQLMEINVVIRKTLVYSTVSAALASVYVATITVLAHFLEGRVAPESAFSSALAAIFITLLFNPLRIRTQRWIDRYFPRERLDPGLLQEAAGGFAHEMKRPLSKISLPAEMALMDLDRVNSGEMSWKDALPKVQERLRFIMNQSIDAGYMVEAIRELSTSSTTPPVSVNLRKIIENALNVERELLEKRDASVEFLCPEDLPTLSGQPKQLEIVFVNLIKNAVEAMSEQSLGSARRMRIELQKERDWIIVNVNDSGPGIKPEDIEKIFQPQYTTKGPYGTGMGLYLTNQIIQAHGGTIDVSSQMGQGTEFTIRFPLRKN